MDAMAPTTIKGQIERVVAKNQPMEIVTGTVISESPLKIQVIGDEKLIVHENIMEVSRCLTDYTVEVDISLDKGKIASLTKMDQGKHGHGPSGGHSQYTGDGTHSHPATEGAHVHNVDTFVLTKATMKVYNALKKGEVVYMLSYNHKKKYLVIDREAAK